MKKYIWIVYILLWVILSLIFTSISTDKRYLWVYILITSVLAKIVSVLSDSSRKEIKLWSQLTFRDKFLFGLISIIAMISFFVLSLLITDPMAVLISVPALYIIHWVLIYLFCSQDLQQLLLWPKPDR